MIEKIKNIFKKIKKSQIFIFLAGIISSILGIIIMQNLFNSQKNKKKESLINENDNIIKTHKEKIKDNEKNLDNFDNAYNNLVNGRRNKNASRKS